MNDSIRMMEGYGVCPVCNGTKEVTLTDDEKRYTWNKGKTHGACRNCGGQYRYIQATGKVSLRKDGTPCKHEYTNQTVDDYLTLYTCNHCGDSYEIDQQFKKWIEKAWQTIANQV
jgi:hypothetical protein